MVKLPSCSWNAHDERSGSGIRVVPCSRSAHDRNVLARRAQLDGKLHPSTGAVNDYLTAPYFTLKGGGEGQGGGGTTDSHVGSLLPERALWEG